MAVSLGQLYHHKLVPNIQNVKRCAQKVTAAQRLIAFHPCGGECDRCGGLGSAVRVVGVVVSDPTPDQSKKDCLWGGRLMGQLSRRPQARPAGTTGLAR